MNGLTGRGRQSGLPAGSSRPVGAKVVTLAVALGVLIFAIAGCRSRVEQTKTASGQATSGQATSGQAAPGASPDAQPGLKFVESKLLANRDDSIDLPFAEEKQETFKLAPGAVVKIERINGKIDIERSANADAELYIVRSVDKGQDLKNRRLILEHKPNELVVRMERERRSALFSMFSERGREKQRIILKLPPKVDLEIEGVSARINVSALDGDLSIDGVNGRVGVTQVAGRTLLSGINGAVRVVADTKNRKDLKVSDVNGAVELLFLGDVNADLRVGEVRGRVDPDLPNLVYDGERRRNDFRAKVGKGGSLVDVSDINGRVRLASASKQDLLPATTASAK